LISKLERHAPFRNTLRSSTISFVVLPRYEPALVLRAQLGDDGTRKVCFGRLVEGRTTHLPLGAFGQLLLPKLRIQTLKMYYSMHPPHGGRNGEGGG
jgi:hypothetical protein